MRLSPVIVLAVYACLAASDVAHLKAGKAKLLAKLAGRARHNKRGAFGTIPTYKLGHDIPYISHSVVKPLVVTYPPTTVPVGVKVPLTHPLVTKYPVGVGHKVPVPHPHYGLKFPHFLLPKPDQHFHHHHHHLAPKPAPLPPPVVPVAQPTAPIPFPVPGPPPVLFPTPVAPVHHVPVPAAPPLHLLPQEHVHLRPFGPAAPVPVAAPLPSPPIYPVAPQYNYILRPGNSVQSSLFATYPKYPLLNYPTPQYPVSSPFLNPVVLGRPQAPHYHLLPHVPGFAGPAYQPTPTVAVHSAGPVAVSPAVLQPTHPPTAIPQLPLDHNGWSPLPLPEAAIPDQTAIQHHLHEGHHFTQEQGTQVYEHHTDEQHYHDYHDHVQHQIHQLEQAEYEQNLNNQHQLNQEYGAPQAHHEYDVQQHINEEAFAQANQEYGAPHPQLQQEYGLPEQQAGREYGPPQQALEARDYDDGDDRQQQYHNHIPLGLQPPIDRPLEHFR